MASLLSEQEALDLVTDDYDPESPLNEYSYVSDSIRGQSRWETHRRAVYKHPTSGLYYVDYSTGSTEIQDYGPYVTAHGPAKAVQVTDYEPA